MSSGTPMGDGPVGSTDGGSATVAGTGEGSGGEGTTAGTTSSGGAGSDMAGSSSSSDGSTGESSSEGSSSDGSTGESSGEGSSSDSSTGESSSEGSSSDGSAGESSSEGSSNTDGAGSSSSESTSDGSSSSSDGDSSSSDGALMCGAQVCSESEVCLGEACSCVAKLSGDTVLRTDQTVIHYDAASTGIVIEDGNSFFDLQGAVDIFEGHEHGCALKDDGTVWCWSDNLNGNDAGELGNGNFGGVTPAWQANPVVLSPDDGGGNLSDVVALNDNSARCYFASTTCAIRDDGVDRTVWCWGAAQAGGSTEGFFNDGDETNHAYPAPIYESPGVVMTDVDAVSLGLRHACAIRDGGDVWCWGTNVGGPLGQGDQVSLNYPAMVNLPGPADEIVAGADVSCARVGDIAYCWGSNSSGQVGIGDPASNTDGCINFCRLTPAPVRDGNDELFTGITDLHGGYLANCATRDDGTLWCWGAQIDPFAAPLSVGGADVADVVMHSACGSGAITTEAVYLNTSDELRQGNTLITQQCD